MKLIKGYDGSGFYIKKLENYILVVSNPVSSPFEYFYELGKEIDRLSQKIPGSQVQVIFNLTPFLRKETVFSMIYNKEKKSLDINSKRTLTEKEIPAPVKKFLHLFVPKPKKN